MCKTSYFKDSVARAFECVADIHIVSWIWLLGEKKLVPDEGIEPPTFGLQNRCSTAELIRRRANPRGIGYQHKAALAIILCDLNKKGPAKAGPS
jgi:hypothetical protein